jgi:hypothetical protein
MATIVNEIDVVLQAAPYRAINSLNAAIVLASSTPAFHISTTGTNDPSSITFTASLIELEGTIVFHATGGTVTTVGNVATMTYANMTSNTATVYADVTVNGATVTSNVCSVSKVWDGAGGTIMSDDPYILDVSKWVIPAGISVSAGASAPGAVTSNYFSEPTYSASNSVVMSARAFPIDPLRTYDLTANLFANTGNNRYMWVLVQFYDAAGVVVGSTGWGGTYSGYVFGAAPVPTGQFNRCGGRFGALVPARLIPSNVRTAKIGVMFQYNAVGSSSVLQGAQDIRLIDVTDAAISAAAAAQAQTDANTANAELANIASDNVLSKVEKSEVILKDNAIVGEFTDIINKADAVSVSRTVYYNSRVAMNAYLAGLSPAWNDTTTNTTIVGSTFRSVFSAYYTAKVELLNAITAAAQGTANTAVANAAAAQADATASLASLTAIFADNVLSRDEKTEVVRRITEVNAEYTPITSQAISLGISHSTFTTTNNALNAYLAALSPAYNDLTQNTIIVRANADAAWNNYYAAKVALLNAIAAKAATTANQDGIIVTPGGGLYQTLTSTVTGGLKIRLPQAGVDTMIRFSVDIYEYATGYSCSLDIAGYVYNVSNTWLNVSARVVGGSNVEYPVYFGYDGTKMAVWIGGAADTWSYPQVRVRDVLAGYTNFSRAQWENNWVISFDTSPAANVTQFVLDTYPAADWRKVVGPGVPSNNASSDITFSSVNMSVVGNTVTKTGATGWDASVYSVQGYTNGAFAEARIVTTSHAIMFGLNQDPTTDANYTSIDYAWYSDGSTSAKVYLNGTVQNGGTGVATIAVGDILSVKTDGVNVFFEQNGVIRWTTPISAVNLKMHFDSSFHTTGGSLTNVRFGPMSNNDYSAIGGDTKAGDNATVGPADAATALGFNPQFSAWPSASSYPTSWGAWTGAAPTKELSSVRTSPFAVKWTVTGDHGMSAQSLFATTPQAVGNYVRGTFDVNITNNNSGTCRPGYLFRLYTNSACTTYVDTIQPAAAGLLGWQRVPFTASVGSAQQIYGLTIYQMASWTSMTGGSSTVGSVCIFDNLTFDFVQPTALTQIVAPGFSLSGVHDVTSSGNTNTSSYVTIDSFTASASGGVGPYTYTWSVSSTGFMKLDTYTGASVSVLAKGTNTASSGSITCVTVDAGGRSYPTTVYAEIGFGTGVPI